MEELPALDALALSLHHAPGVYALLVGSGLSSAAGIPTGWQITIDLIRKLKCINGDCEEASTSSEDDLLRWYKEKYQKDPDYSDLLGLAVPSIEVRNKFLQTHIEGDAQNARQPTQAHQKIAQLVKGKKIKLIITTNFDRLLEQALQAEEIDYNIIPNEDAIKGSEPLVHASCTLVKVHGDYRDMRIKNTNQELAKYSPKLNKYLDRIFDDFGLIVVGWSADWDQALFDAIMRAPNRRYSFYWAAHGGKPGANAQKLIDQRKGRVIEIQNADDLFKTLADKVEGLDRLQGPHPVSVSAALGLARKYCRDDHYAMEWADFLHAEVEKIRKYITGPDYPLNSNYKNNNNNSNSFNRLVEKSLTANNQVIDGFSNKTINILEDFQARTEILRRAALICGRWGTENATRELIAAIRALTFEDLGFNGIEIELRTFGASMCFYWTLMGLVEARQWQIVKELFYNQVNDKGHIKSFLCKLPPQSWDSNHPLVPKNDQNKRYLEQYFFDNLINELKDISLSGSRINQLLEVSEFYISIEFILQLKKNKKQIEDDEDHFRYYAEPLWLFSLKIFDKFKPIKDQFTNLSDDDQRFKIGLFGLGKDKLNEALKILIKIQNNTLL